MLGMKPKLFRTGASCGVAALLLAGMAATAQAEWVYRTVRVCEPVTRSVQRCQPVRTCQTSYRFESRYCSTCNPPRQEMKRVPYQACAMQTQCRRETVTSQRCRNEQRRVWVQNPKVIPKKVPPVPADEQ